MIPQGENDKLVDEKDLEESIINLSVSLGKNDVVSEIFLEELFKILLPRTGVKKSWLPTWFESLIFVLSKSPTSDLLGFYWRWQWTRLW